MRQPILEDGTLSFQYDELCIRAARPAVVDGFVDLTIGGKLDRTFASPYSARVHVKRFVPHTGGIPPRALVHVGGVEVVLQSDRRPFTTVRHFESMGLNVHRKKLIVIKLGYLFPELRDLAPYHIIALSPGFGDRRIELLPFHSLRRPIYPLDPDVEWYPKARGQI